VYNCSKYAVGLQDTAKKPDRPIGFKSGDARRMSF
jgi:hypothetical protein